MRSEIVRARDPFYSRQGPDTDTAACFDILRDWDFGFVHQVLTFTRRHNELRSSAPAAALKAGGWISCAGCRVMAGFFWTEQSSAARWQTRLASLLPRAGAADLSSCSGQLFGGSRPQALRPDRPAAEPDPPAGRPWPLEAAEFAPKPVATFAKGWPRRRAQPQPSSPARSTRRPGNREPWRSLSPERPETKL